MRRLSTIFILVSFLAQACIETEPVSPIPEVGFKSFELLDAIDTLGNYIKVGQLEFTFIDGDADFGIEATSNSDNLDIENSNIFLTAYNKIDSLYFPIEIDTNNPPLYFRVTNATPLVRVGQNKTVKGIITLNIEYQILPEYDTIRYDFYILDRAFNKSNVESTSDIGFKGVTLPKPEL